METIKVIDLLNKIAKGEEVPEEIFFKNKTFIFDGARYLTNNGDEELTDYLAGDGLTSYWLNCEVEIIEEDNKIEKLNTQIDYTSKVNYEILDKINELIDEVNKLKGVKK